MTTTQLIIIAHGDLDVEIPLLVERDYGRIIWDVSRPGTARNRYTGRRYDLTENRTRAFEEAHRMDIWRAL